MVTALRILLGGWLKSAWAASCKYPLQVALALSLCWGAWERHQHTGWRDYAHRLESASQVNAEATKALRAKETSQSKETARHVDTEHIAARPASDAASVAFIARNRVQPKGDRSPAVPVDQAGDPGLPAPVPAETVMVPSEDVLTCGRLYDYALDAHNHAVLTGQ